MPWPVARAAVPLPRLAHGHDLARHIRQASKHHELALRAVVRNGVTKTLGGIAGSNAFLFFYFVGVQYTNRINNPISSFSFDWISE